MESLDTYLQSYLDYKSAESSFIDELGKYGITKNHIKDITVSTEDNDTKVTQIIIIELRGSLHLSVDALSNIPNVSIVTPNTILIKVGEIHL